MKKLIAVLAATTLMAIAAPGAYANSITSTSPNSSESLKVAPTAVTITTELPVIQEGSEVVVTDPSGARVDLGSISAVDNTILVDLKPIKSSGIYTVTYSILAENDVPLTGRFTFNFAAPEVISTPTAQPTPTQAPTPSGNNAGTTMFVLGLLLAAVVVTVALARYARKLYSER
jgi:methionine-rich copper-binding protein CopC